MASSSSAKKVARVAAKSGTGRPAGAAATGNQRNWLFAASIVAIVALGVGIVLFARDKNEGLGENTTPPKANLQDGEPFDHWHAAFAISVCGKELPPIQDGATDPLGIHTHGDGLIHIHPFTRSSGGNRATLGKYLDQVDFIVTNTGFQLPNGLTTEDGGTTVKEGETTCGGEPGELVLAKWKDGATAADSEPDQIIREGFDSVRFTEDRSAMTLAFVPKGSTDISAPSTAPEIDALGAADGGASPNSSGEAPAGEQIEIPTEETTITTGDTTVTTVAGEAG